MLEKGTLVVLGALIALFIKLTIMPEVRRVRDIVGGKNVHLKIKPQQINPFYIHNKNYAICNDFFYRRILIKYSYYFCLFFTIAAIAIGFPNFFSNTQTSTKSSAVHTTPPPLNKIADLDLTTVKGNTLLTVHDDGTYSMFDASNGTEIILINSDGNVLRIFEGNNILFASIYFGILVGILCLVLAGPLKKIE